MDVKTLFQDLAHAPGIIYDLIVEFPPEEARRRPAPEAWSALEVLGHLIEEERNDFRPRLEVVLFRPEQPWASVEPASAPAAPDYNQRDPEDLVNEFMNERQRSVVWLDRIKETANWEATYQAPFGLIRAGDLLAAWVAHDTLHMRQLVELRYACVRRLADPYRVDYAGEW